MSDVRKMLGPIIESGFDVYRRFCIDRTFKMKPFDEGNHILICTSIIPYNRTSPRDWVVYIAGNKTVYYANLTLDEAKEKFDGLLVRDGYILITEEQTKKIEILL